MKKFEKIVQLELNNTLLRNEVANLRKSNLRYEELLKTLLWTKELPNNDTMKKLAIPVPTKQEDINIKYPPTKFEFKPEIVELKDSKYITSIIHIRNDNQYNHVNATLVGIVKENKLNIGISFCHEKDNFSKKVGREQALDRAINNPIVFPWLKTSNPKEIKMFLYEFAELCKNTKNTLVENLYNTNKNK
jgi:hypothetical protein